MKVVVAMDSMKGSLSSLEAGNAVSEGIHRVFRDAEVTVCPLADGGEGTVEALTLGMNGTIEKVNVTGPLGSMIEASYGRIAESNTAIIEMSAAAGITLVNESDRNPLHTTTYGGGDLIRDAIKKGCRKFIVGIGGSATNDGGIGMLEALGYGFLDADGKQVPYGANGLALIETITDEHVMPELKECKFRIACDVTNPLCGANGCSAVFGPQKGATQTMITKMDTWLMNYAKKTKEKYSDANPNQAGTGAAGGLGFAFLSYTNAVLESGVKIILEETKLESFIKNADFVITGEGRLDGQTVMGKAPIGVAEIAKKYEKKVLAFGGCVAEDATLCNQYGIDAFFPILRTVTTLKEAMDFNHAKENLSAAVEQVFRLIQSFE